MHCAASGFTILPPIIAHRGANRFAPENTLAAFLKAKQLGFNWVELDVMLTADNEPVVIHDETLTRTTNGKGAVVDYPFDDLKTLDAGSWFDARFAGERISHLQTVLAFLCEHHLSANIEIKALQNRNRLVAEKVVEIVRYYPETPSSVWLISSFASDVLQYVREGLPNSWLGFLMDEWVSEWEMRCDSLRCVSVHVNEAVLTEERVHAVKATGRQLLAYTVNDPARAVQLYAWGVDAIFSDCPQPIADMVR